MHFYKIWLIFQEVIIFFKLFKVFSFLIKLEMTSADLFIFLVSTFLSDFEVFSNKRNDCLAWDSNPGPLACEATAAPYRKRPKLWYWICRSPHFCQNQLFHFHLYLSVCHFRIQWFEANSKIIFQTPKELKHIHHSENK